MPSPDLPGYVDLTIFDLTPAQLVERVRANLLVTLPGFVYRAGTPEAALTESLVLLVAENGYQINRIPGAVFETLMSAGFGVTLYQGAPPTATVTVTVADNLGYTIPAGTRFRLALGETSSVVFTLDADLDIAPGDVAGDGAVTGTTNTAVANGTAVGTLLRTVDAVPAIESVVIAVEPAGGAGVEAVADWFDRGAARLSRLSDTLVVAAHFEAAAVELEPTVVRVKAYDLFDATVGGGSVPGDHPGHISIAVADAAGAALAAPIKAALETAMDALAVSDLEVHIFDPTITNVTVTATVLRQLGFTNAEVQANVMAALEAYLSPAAWPWGGTVYRFELISVIDQVEGVDRVVSLTAPAADTALAGSAPLADFNAGASVITVTAP